MTIKQEYYAQIREWNWTGIKSDASQGTLVDGDGTPYGAVYLGTVQSLAPSGRYTAPWARADPRDAAFFRALDHVAAENGMWIESGEGDPCDLYACISIETIEE